MSTVPTQLAIMGLGRAGKFHLQSLRQTHDAVAVCVHDIDQVKSKSIAIRENCASAESALEAIGRDDVDAVIVCTPTDRQFELVQMCLDAGNPVLTEKPLGRHLHEIDDSFQQAAELSVPLFVAFQRRFDPAFSSLVQAVHSGGLGQLQFVRSVSRDNPVPSTEYIRISGGIFHDCMVHDLDMVCHIVGEIPTHMSAFGSSFIPDIGACDDFDSVAAMLIFASGITASIDINRKSVYGYDQRIETFGNNGMLQADNYHNTSVVQAGPGGFARPPVDYSFPTRYREAYLQELLCFVRCVRREEEVPITHEDVRINHLLASGLETAAREKRVVAFEELDS